MIHIDSHIIISLGGCNTGDFRPRLISCRYRPFLRARAWHILHFGPGLIKSGRRQSRGFHVSPRSVRHLATSYPKKSAARFSRAAVFQANLINLTPKKKKHKQGLFWAQSLAELSAISGAMGKGLNRGNCARRVDSAWDFFLEMEMP